MSWLAARRGRRASLLRTGHAAAVAAMLLGTACGVEREPPDRAAGGDSRPAASAPLNVVLVVVDTLRADVLGCYGGPLHTPNIDALARSGLRFTHAYSHIPITGPSHATMFTSQLPAEHGYHNNPQILADTKHTLAEVLAGNGWHSAAFVSLGVLRQRHGLNQGFDEYHDDFALDWFKGAGEVNREVFEWLGSRTREPFFLWVHYSEPHEPYTPRSLVYPSIRIHAGDGSSATMVADGRTFEMPLPPLDNGAAVLRLEPDTNTETLLEFRKLSVTSKLCEAEVGTGFDVDERRFGAEKYRSTLPATVTIHCRETPPADATFQVMALEEIDSAEKRRRYMLEVEDLDREVGALLDELDRLGLGERSLVIFTADHGESLGEHDFTGHVTQLYEPLVHVPLLIRQPELFAAGTTIDATARHLDLMPTLLDALGLETPTEARGRSLMPLLRSGESSAASVVATTYRPEARFDRSALIAGGYKLVFTADTEQLELYDLSDDPGELSDLVTAEPERTRIMAQELRRMLDEAQGQAAASAELSDEDREQLRALGYLE